MAEPVGNGPGSGGTRAAECSTGGTLTVLGCDGSFPGPGGATSGYLVAAGGATVWLDAGFGTFANLQRHGDPRAVGAVVISHEHPDHRSDLDAFAVWLRHARLDRPVPVYAPSGVRARCYYGDAPVFDWHEVQPAQRVVVEARPAGGGARAGDADEGDGDRPGALVCSFVATDHGPPTLGVRFDRCLPGETAVGSAGAAGALAYSADTGPEWSVEELGRGIGTFLCEATYPRSYEGSFRHLSGRQAGSMAAAADVGTLVLTHRWATVPAEELTTEAAVAFGAPVRQAAVGRVVAW